MIRYFIGLRPTPAFQDALTGLQASLKEAGVTGRFQEAANLHLTLAFIGQRPEPPETFLSLLPQVDRPFPLILSHPGLFPEAGILWAGVAPSEELVLLAERVRRKLRASGVFLDGSPFVPHITLARKPSVPDGVDLAAFAVPPAEMTVREVCLYRSDRGERGMVYTVIGRTGEAEGHTL